MSNRVMSGSDKDSVSDEVRIAVLRAEIRRVGRLIARVELGAPVASVAMLLAACVLVPVLLIVEPRWLGPVPAGKGWLGQACILLARAGLTGVLLGVPLSMVYRGRQVAAIRARLATSSSQERTTILLPLWSEPGDTRDLAEELNRGFRVGGELVPAAAPDARGDEASPAEKGP